MQTLHNMLPEDEIFLCGTALLVGLVIGMIARFIVAWRARRTA